MNKTILTALMAVITTLGFGQTTQVKYFKNETLKKEVPFGRGKFSQSITNNENGTTTIVVKNMKTDQVIQSETYKGEEPYGIWIYSTELGLRTLDYNFELKYSDIVCNDSIPGLRNANYYKDDISIGYKAPKISTGESTIYHFLAKELNYPPRAKELKIQGKISIVFTFNEDGTTDNFYVLKGENVLLAKEAVRAVKKMAFSTPPTLRGHPKRICVMLTLNFGMEGE